MTTTDVWTIGRLLTWTTDFLAKHGSDSPRLDAEVLLAHARGCERIQLYTAFHDEPEETARTAFREMVRRRSEGTPVAYLVGHREFFSLDFRVNPDCLIPRPDTEHLVIAAADIAKKHWQANPQRACHLVDVGTGSGCVGISLAKQDPRWAVTLVDLSPTALEVARANAQAHGLLERVALWQSDLLESVPTPDGGWDLIVSNPPYISQAEYAELPRDVREFEPELALVGGPQGDEITLRLIDQAAGRLAPGGWLLVETSPMLAPRLIDAWSQRCEWSSPTAIKDLQGHARILIGQLRSSSSDDSPP